MAARGSVAKENIAKKLQETFGKDYIGEFDRKYFIWGNDGGERVQIAISMTCPKTPIEVDKTIDTGGDWDFTDTPKTAAIPIASAAPAEITQDELDNVAELMRKLGL